MFNLPNISFLNKTARSLLHLVFETKGIDRGKKEVILKCFYWQTNALSGKTYTKYLRQKVDGRMIAIRRINIGLPTKELTIPYEKRKDEFVNKTMDSLIEAEDNIVEKNKNEPREIWVAIKKVWDEGITNHGAIAERLGTRRQHVTKNLAIMEQKGLIKMNYLKNAEKSQENKEKSASSLVLAPIST